jgi:hypothetical protein
LSYLGFAPTQQQAKDKADELKPIVVEGKLHFGYTLAVEPSEVYQEEPNSKCLLWERYTLDYPSWLEMK